MCIEHFGCHSHFFRHTHTRTHAPQRKRWNVSSPTWTLHALAFERIARCMQRREENRFRERIQSELRVADVGVLFARNLKNLWMEVWRAITIMQRNLHALYVRISLIRGSRFADGNREHTSRLAHSGVRVKPEIHKRICRRSVERALS